MDDEENFDTMETSTFVRCRKCRTLLDRTAIQENNGKCPYCGTQIFGPEHE